MPSDVQLDEWEPIGLRVFTERGRCPWHDTVLVERLPEHPQTFYCVLCADDLRKAARKDHAHG